MELITLNEFKNLANGKIVITQKTKINSIRKLIKTAKQNKMNLEIEIARFSPQTIGQIIKLIDEKVVFNF